MSNEITVIRATGLRIGFADTLVQVNRLKKGKKFEKAEHAVSYGANAAILTAAASGAVRKALVAGMGEGERARIACDIAHGVTYTEAWATVRGMGNVTEVADC